MKWYAEQIDALRAENEQLRSQVAGLELERDQALYAIRKGGPAVTEQERKDIQEAIETVGGFKKALEALLTLGEYEWAEQESIHCQLAIQALRRWLDEDREDREHDES